MNGIRAALLAAFVWACAGCGGEWGFTSSPSQATADAASSTDAGEADVPACFPPLGSVRDFTPAPGCARAEEVRYVTDYSDWLGGGRVDDNGSIRITVRMTDDNVLTGVNMRLYRASSVGGGTSWREASTLTWGTGSVFPTPGSALRSRAISWLTCQHAAGEPLNFSTRIEALEPMQLIFSLSATYINTISTNAEIYYSVGRDPARGGNIESVREWVGAHVTVERCVCHECTPLVVRVEQALLDYSINDSMPSFERAWLIFVDVN